MTTSATISQSLYSGSRHGGVHVSRKDLATGQDAELSPSVSLALCNHSPTGFEWGYGGSGPAQLALALLLDATGNPELALRLHQSFKWNFVARWRGDWEISSQTILDWVHAHR